jgi:hypothetical protein
MRAVAEFSSDGLRDSPCIGRRSAQPPDPYGVVRPQDFDEEGYPVLRGCWSRRKRAVRC